MRRVAKIVIDLGFGDSGKGAAIDSLAMECTSPIGIRFSGGQQCGHTVYTDKDRSHIHASFSSVALRGFPTYLTEQCCMYPPVLKEESIVIGLKGGCNKMFIHPRVLVTTPYDIAWNRVTEQINRHGSVGLGIGATNSRNRDTGYQLRVVDLTYPELFAVKLKQIEKWYLSRMMKEYPLQIDEFSHIYTSEMPGFMEACNNYNELFTINHYDILFKYPELLFEGSQGVMLDMDHGIFPNVTYAKTTSVNALELCMALGAEPELYYVTRCYSSRHGNGWMPNEGGVALINNEVEINTLCEWQGVFRTGPLNYDLLNYALRCDNIHAGDSIPKFLVVSCCDQLPEFKFEPNKINGTTIAEVFYRSSHISKPFSELERAGQLEVLLTGAQEITEQLDSFEEVEEEI